MAYSIYTPIGDGTTKIFNVPFGYISKEHVKVFLNGAEQTNKTDYEWLDTNRIQFLTAPAQDVLVTIRRYTPVDQKVVDFINSSILKEETLDLSTDYNRYIVQEAFDSLTGTITIDVDGNLNAEGARLKNIGDAVEPTDAVNLQTMNSLFPQAQEAEAAAQAAQDAAEAAVTAADSAEQKAQYMEDTFGGTVPQLVYSSFKGAI